MQSTHKIPGDAAAGFAAYLTSGRSRGDYYTAGEDEAAAGFWHGSSAGLGQLGIDPSEPVERDDLVAVMRGVSPASGEPFRRAGGDGSRVAGIDATFSAPKSVSALWAVSSPYRRAQIEAAHCRAVGSAISRIESQVELVRRRSGGRLRWERARRLVAAEFVHTSSRLTRDQEGRGGVPDPQLHSHVVVLAAERQDGRFAAVDSRELFRSARENGAWYRAELAHNLQQLGLEVRGRTGKDGRYFELAGVPEGLSERWSARAADIERAAQRFRQRYGRDPRAGELGMLTVSTRGSKTMTAQVDVDEAWRAVGEEYGLSRRRAERLFFDRVRAERRDLAGELVGDVTRERSTIPERELKARSYELAAGVCRPEEAEREVQRLARVGELVELEGRVWTTRELRALEARTVDGAAGRSAEQPAPVSDRAVNRACERAEDRVGALSAEQEGAVRTVTGRGGVSVLVGQAGAGKGVVIGAAREAWEAEGHRVIGTAVAGATAKRLEADAGISETMTADALLRRTERGSLRLDGRSVVVMDEAGMADTRRLAALNDRAGRSGAKLVLVGDPAQLGSIGAGGLFGSLAGRVPTAELSEVRRARHEWETRAWQDLREGEAERALAAYRERGRLHVSDTRAHAREDMVGAWDRARRQVGVRGCVMVTDASNRELDELNALAQDRRAQAGELGRARVGVPGRPYGLARGDEVMFAAPYYRPGERRVENGTRARVIGASRLTGEVTVRTAGPQPRDVRVRPQEFSDVRLAYAQHVYKAQGLTVERAFVLCGGWQTDRERAYVALSRARERTDVYACREDLGEDGLDAGAIDRLAGRMSASRAQEASITRPQRDPGLDVRAESEVGRILREQRARERERERGFGLEL